MKILIDLDEGFLGRIERERYVVENTTGKRPARTTTIRTLLTRALDAACTDRGEAVPVVAPAGDVEEVGGTQIAPETTA